MTTQKEIDEIFINTLENVIQLCEKITPGNVAHYVVPIKGRCQSMIQFYRENSVTHWHSVKDGDLPTEPQGDEFDMPFIVSTNGEDVLFAYYAHKEDEKSPEFYDDCELPLEVEYWAELPKLPENKK